MPEKTLEEISADVLRVVIEQERAVDFVRDSGRFVMLAEMVLAAFAADDLWIDGTVGASYLREAAKLAEDLLGGDHENL